MVDFFPYSKIEFYRQQLFIHFSLIPFTIIFLGWHNYLLCCDISDNSIEMEDASEAESRGKSSAPTSPLILDEFSLTVLRTQPKCEVYPDLHKIIQVLSPSLTGKNCCLCSSSHIFEVELVIHFQLYYIIILVISKCMSFTKVKGMSLNFEYNFPLNRINSWRLCLSISKLCPPIHITSSTARRHPRERWVEKVVLYIFHCFGFWPVWLSVLTLIFHYLGIELRIRNC